MTDQKWNMEQILWDLIPNTIKIGVRSFTPETIRSITAEDLQSLVKVFTRRPFCYAPTMTEDQATTVPGVGTLAAETYVYRFTSTSEYDEGAETGESASESYVVVTLPSIGSVEWSIRGFICNKASGFKVYRSDPVAPPPPGQRPIHYKDIETKLRYIETGIPDTFTDDGSDPDFAEESPPTENTAFYDPGLLDPSHSLDEIRNKILQLGEMLNLSVAPEKYLPYLFYFLRSTFDPADSVEEQIEEFKKRLDVIKIRTTIPSIMRVIKKKRHETGFTTGSELDSVYEPFKHIAKYSHAVLSGTKIWPEQGKRYYSATGRIYLANPDVLVETSGSPIFADAEEGHRIIMPYEGGDREGFKISKVLSNTEVFIPQATAIWEDPRYRNATQIDVEYYLFIPFQESHHITDWEYWHHGVYEIQTTLNPSLVKDEILETIHPAGTRIYFQYLLTMFLCEDIDNIHEIDWASWMVQVTEVTRGATDTDEITEPYFRHIRGVVHVNEGGTFDLETYTFQGGIDYPINGDWEFVKDETSFPDIKYYIKWTGSSPAPGTVYQVLYVDCKAYFSALKGAELGIYIEPLLRDEICGLVLSVGPALSMPGATLSGCISELEEIGLYIDMGNDWPLPVIARRFPHWSATLKYYDLNGVIGYLCGIDSPDPFAACWVTDGYKYDDEPPYLDAQGRDDIEALVYTEGDTILHNSAGGMDEFIPNQTKFVDRVLEVNAGGTWDKINHTYGATGTPYVEGDDWVLYIDDSVFPNKFYIDWSPGGAEPSPGTYFDLAYVLEV